MRVALVVELAEHATLRELDALVGAVRERPEVTGVRVRGLVENGRVHEGLPYPGPAKVRP